MSGITPSTIWKFHELVLEERAADINLCKRLESREVGEEELHSLKHAEPIEANSDILYWLGVATGSTGNPLPASQHSRVLQARRGFLAAIQQSDWLAMMCLLARFSNEGVDVVVDPHERDAKQEYCAQPPDCICAYRKQLEAIEPDALEAECQVACRKLEGEQELPIYLGDGKIEYNGQTFHIDGQMKDVIEALVELRAASMSELQNHSRVQHASTVLARFQKKNAPLAPFVCRPGREGKGSGYSTTIVNQSSIMP